VFPIVLAPLRERSEDIPLLVRHFADRIARRLGRRIDGVEAAFVERARQYAWPGNVRELENVIERALIVVDGGALDASGLLGAQPAAAPAAAAAAASLASLEDVERAHIRRVLDALRWRIEGEAGAARVLGLNPSTLRGRLRKLGIRKD
jgi:transcriptional regulator with GAF, ATPase, and Fis domain